MKRIFIAIPLPQNIRAVLHAMGRSLPGVRAVPEEQMHITLRFIGDVDGTTLLDIKENLAAVSHTPFYIAVKGVGHFPPRGKPRVIWTGLQPAEELKKLKRKVDTSLIKSGIPADTRKYSPHVTLARINSTPLKRVTEFLAGNAFLAFDEFQVTSYTLYSSKLSHKGAIHTVEEKYALRAQ